MKTFFALVCVLVVVMGVVSPIAVAAQADPIVQCDGSAEKPCTWDEFGKMLIRILDFIVTNIAVPLGVLAMVVGAIFLLTSAGRPNMVTLGKTILWSAIIGLMLALCAKLIINFILKSLDYKGGGLSISHDSYIAQKFK